MDKYYGRIGQRGMLTPIRIETIKFLIQYLLILIASSVAGGAFTFFLGKDAYVSFFCRIYTHFSLPFSYCRSVGDVASVLMRFATPKIIAAAVIFLFSFSVLNHLATQLVLITEGFKFGFSACILFRLCISPAIREYLSVFLCAVYFIASLLLLILLVRYSVDLARRSIAVRCYSSVGRPSFSAGVLARLFLCYLKYCVLILSTYSIYCMIIFFVNKG